METRGGVSFPTCVSAQFLTPKVSGKRGTTRPALSEALAYVRHGKPPIRIVRLGHSMFWKW